MMDIVKRIESKEIAIDHGFYVANGNWELCHHRLYGKVRRRTSVVERVSGCRWKFVLWELNEMC